MYSIVVDFLPDLTDFSTWLNNQIKNDRKFNIYNSISLYYMYNRIQNKIFFKWKSIHENFFALQQNIKLFLPFFFLRKIMDEKFCSRVVLKCNGGDPKITQAMEIRVFVCKESYCVRNDIPKVFFFLYLLKIYMYIRKFVI